MASKKSKKNISLNVRQGVVTLHTNAGDRVLRYNSRKMFDLYARLVEVYGNMETSTVIKPDSCKKTVLAAINPKNPVPPDEIFVKEALTLALKGQFSNTKKKTPYNDDDLFELYDELGQQPIELAVTFSVAMGLTELKRAFQQQSGEEIAALEAAINAGEAPEQDFLETPAAE